jgi:error-prone DNA polymerase
VTHPIALLRPNLASRRLVTAAELESVPNGRLVHYCGIVTLRQQPETANGTVFISLEDETGVIQVICWKSLRDAQQGALRSRLLVVHGWRRRVATASPTPKRRPIAGRRRGVNAEDA